MPDIWNSKAVPLRRLLRQAGQSNWWQVVSKAGRRWGEVDGGHRAAAISYYLLLSLFPLGVLLVTTGSLFVERDTAAGEVVRLVNRYTPLTGAQEQAAAETIRGLFEARGQINLAAIALLIWGGLKFLRAFIRTSNRIWHAETYNWWRLPMKSLALLGVTASAVLVGILLPGLVRMFRSWLTAHLELSVWVFNLLAGLVPWLVLF